MPPAPTSPPPRLHVNGQTRSLNFGSDLVQSSMRLDAPDELLLEYTRAMMGLLLFIPQPAHVLMIGLGGGSLPKYCHRHLPATRVTVVEISQDVIDLRDDFGLPPDDRRLQVVCAEGAAFVAGSPERYDAILVDGFDAQGQPPALCTPAFYRQCAAHLAGHGLLVVNLHGQEPALSLMARRLSKAFQGSAIAVGVDDGDNRVVFAGARSTLQACLQAFEQRWAALSPVHQRTLGAASSRIERALRRGYLTVQA